MKISSEVNNLQEEIFGLSYVQTVFVQHAIPRKEKLIFSYNQQVAHSKKVDDRFAKLSAVSSVFGYYCGMLKDLFRF